VTKLVSRRYQILIVAIVVAGSLGAAAALLPGLNQSNGGHTVVVLPPGCVKPAGGFLIVASQYGYNDSVDHGVPENSWPVMHVSQGQNITIVVCDADPAQDHGFQIEHYYDSRLVSISPGQVLTVSFIADEAGSFRVYCSVPCSVHWAMQSGELIVS